jgi:hypothetical protein
VVVWVEGMLVKSGAAKLPGKKAPLEDNEIEIILVDVTESPVERPKKTTRAVLGEIERINAKIKVFKTTSNKYRNRRKHF